MHSHNCSYIRKKRHDTCLPTGGSSTAKPEGRDTVAERQTNPGGQVLPEPTYTAGGASEAYSTA